MSRSSVKELEMSLDEIIHSKDYKQRKMKSQTNSSTSSLEYQAIVKQTDKKFAECSLEDKMDTIDTEGASVSTIDMSKSLEEIIRDRGVLKTYMDVGNTDKINGAGRGRGRGKRQPEIKNVTFKLDPKTNTLDDIIKERGFRRPTSPTRFPSATSGKRPFGSDHVDALNGIMPIYAKRTRTIKNPLTPHRAVTFLSERGMIIELKIGKLVDEPDINSTYQQAHLWRCEVNCGDIKGLSDSCRKRVAREMACLDFLKTLAHNYQTIVIPEYEVPDEVFIDPHVFDWVEKLAIERSVDLTYNTAIKNKEGAQRRDHYVYVCTYYFGDDEFVAERPNPEYARLNAAKKVYESVTGTELPRTRYSLADKCDLDAQYDFSESEVYHVLDVDTENGISNQQAVNMNGQISEMETVEL